MDFELVGAVRDAETIAAGRHPGTQALWQGSMAQAEGCRNCPSPGWYASPSGSPLVWSSWYRPAGDEDQVPATGL